MKTVKVKSYAKVNLTLEIVGQTDEYHALDSLVASVDLFDVILLRARKDKLSSITMKGLGSESIPPEQNNALKAAEAFSQTFGVNGADITVYKNIPMGAGLGGSSADASGVLNGMAKLYGVDDKMSIERLADTLGSDTRYMLNGGFARMQGKGGTITPLQADATLHFLAICPKDGCSSGACYKEYDKLAIEKKGGIFTQNAIDCLQSGDISGVGRCLTNDLFAPATRLCESVQTAYEQARSFSPLGAVMTGSGSCVLAMFETRELCEWAQSRYRGKFRTLVLKTCVPKSIKKWRNPFILDEE
jgi:4-diphosphocytidyl-2-C-methyl-D-erythritol kinase